MTHGGAKANDNFQLKLNCLRESSDHSGSQSSLSDEKEEGRMVTVGSGFGTLDDVRAGLGGYDRQTSEDISEDLESNFGISISPLSTRNKHNHNLFIK